MYFWIIILLSLFFFSLLPKNYTKYTYWFCVVFLIVIAGFRGDNVGTDTSNYIIMFNSTARSGQSYVEEGWVILSKFVAIFTDNHHYFFLFISAFTLITTSVVWTKHVENKQISLFIYFAIYAYCASLNIMRQYASISVVLIGYSYIVNHKKLKAILFILLAATLHTSALICLPLIFIDKLKLNNGTFCLFIIFISLLIGWLPIEKVLIYLSGKYVSYFYDNKKLFRDNAIFIYLLCLIYSSLFIYLYYKTDKNIRRTPYLKIYFVGVVLNNILFRFDLGTRLFLYFAVIQTLFLPTFMNKKYQYTKWVIYAYLLGYCSIMLLRNSADVYPYVFYIG